MAQQFGGIPTKTISHQAIIDQVCDKEACQYVWPLEGEWKRARFVFHKGSYIDEDSGLEIEYPTGPLFVDLQSANAYKLVYEAINDKNKLKLREFTEEHRGMFVWALDTLVWPNVSFGGRPR